MARHKTPSNVLDLKGSYKKHPERRNNEEPEGLPLDSKPPKYFDKEHVKHWNDLISRIPDGVVTNSDYYLLVIGAAILAEIEETQGHLPNERIAKFVTISAKLGLTPSDRVGLKVPQKKKNKFDDI